MDGNARSLAYFYKFYRGQKFIDDNNWNFNNYFNLTNQPNPIGGYNPLLNFDRPQNQSAIKDKERGPFPF
jgi:hypothetical protein